MAGTTHMSRSIACPNCNRNVFTRRDLLYATLEGAARCRFCGKGARLDIPSRCTLACVLALILPQVLLYGGVFYSGHLFLISTAVILGSWGMLSWAGSPFLKLETVPASTALDRRTAVLVLVVILVVAIVIDGYMTTRFD